MSETYNPREVPSRMDALEAGIARHERILTILGGLLFTIGLLWALEVGLRLWALRTVSDVG